MTQIVDSLINAETSEEQIAKMPAIFNAVESALQNDAELSRGARREVRNIVAEAQSSLKNFQIPATERADFLFEKREKATPVLGIFAQEIGPQLHQEESANVGPVQPLYDKMGLPTSEDPQVQEAFENIARDKDIYDKLKFYGPNEPWMERVRKPMGLAQDVIDWAVDLPAAAARLPFNIANLALLAGELTSKIPETAAGEWEAANLRGPLTGILGAVQMAATGMRAAEEQGLLGAAKEPVSKAISYLSEHDPKMAELNDQLMLDALTGWMFGPGLRGVTTGAQAYAKAVGTAAVSGAAGGQVATALLDEPIKQAMRDPSDASLALLGVSAIAAIGGAATTEIVLNRMLKNPAYIRAAGEAGRRIADNAPEVTRAVSEGADEIEVVRGMLQSEDISPEARAAFEALVAKETTGGTDASVRSVLEATPPSSMGPAEFSLEAPPVEASIPEGVIPGIKVEAPPIAGQTDEGLTAIPAQTDTAIPETSIGAKAVTGPTEASGIEGAIAEVKEIDPDTLATLQYAHMAAKAEGAATRVGMTAEEIAAVKGIAGENRVTALQTEKALLEDQSTSLKAAEEMLREETGGIDLGALRVKLNQEGVDSLTAQERRAIVLDDNITAVGERLKNIDGSLQGVLPSPKGAPKVPTAKPTKYSIMAEHLLDDPSFNAGVKLAKAAREFNLKRDLSVDELRELTEEMARNSGKWHKIDAARAAVNEAANPLENIPEGIKFNTPAFSSDVIGKKYPLAATALRAMSGKAPSAAGNYFSLNDIARATTALNHALGPRMTAEAFDQLQPSVMEVNALWDVVRKGAQPEERGIIAETLAEMLPKKDLPAIKRLQNKLTNLYGEQILDVDIRTGAPENGLTAASYQSTVRRINLQENSPQALLHEVGHHIFMQGLDAEQRLGFINQMRKTMDQLNGWEKAFPGYAKALEAAGTDAEKAAVARYWTTSPEEAFAQQAIALLGAEFIPNAKTATTLGAAIQRFTKVFGVAFDDFKGIPPEAKEMFTKAAVMPKLERLAVAQETTFDDIAGLTTVIPKEAEAASAYADELAEVLSIRQGAQLPESVLEDMSIGQLQGDLFAGMDVTPPEVVGVAQRVLSYKIADLPKALSVQVIRGALDDARFDLAELKLLMARTEHVFESVPPAEMQARLLAQDSVRVKRASQAFDAQTGGESESFAQKISREREELAKEMQRTGDPEAERVSARQKALLQSFAKEARFESQLKKRQLTDEEKARIWRRVNEKEGATAKDNIRDALETSQARQLYAATKMESEQLMDAARKVLVKNDAAQNIPESFLIDMKAADTVGKLSAGRFIGSMAYSGAWRSLLLSSACVQSDENGYDTPFGKISFSLSAAYDKGLLGAAALAIAGGKPARAGLRQMSKLADNAMTKLSPQMRSKVQGVVESVQRNFGPNSGMTPEQKRLLTTFQRDKRAMGVEHLELAQILKEALTPEERNILSMIVTRDTFPGWEGKVAGASLKVKALSEAVRTAYDKTAHELLQSGVSLKKLSEVENYMNRIYLERAPKAPGKWIPNKLMPKVPSGLRLDFLKDRGVTHVLESKGGAAFGDQMYQDRVGSRKDLTTALASLAEPESAKIHSYQVISKNPDGQITERVYAIRGSELDSQLAKSKNAFKDTQDWRVNKMGKGKLSLRRDYTHSERALRGETMDAAAKMATFGEIAGKDIAKMRLFKRIGEFPEHVRSEMMPTEVGDVPSPSVLVELQSSNWWKVPDKEVKGTGAKVYGDLAGKWVSPEMKEVLLNVDAEGGIAQAIREYAPNAYKRHKLLLGAWKMGKTVFQPATHVTNIVGNVMQSWLAGENPLSVIRHGYEMIQARRFDTAYNNAIKRGDKEGLRGLVNKLQASPALHDNWALYKETRHMQLGESSILSSDASVQELMKEVIKLEDAQRIGDVANPAMAAATAVENAVSRSYVQAMMKGGKAVTKTAAGWYEMGDLFFKLGTYKAAKMGGASSEEALSRAYKAHFDYGDLPKAPQMLKDTGIMPFASYAYKSAELMADTALNRPGRLAMAALAFEAIHMRTMASTYGLEGMVSGDEYETAALSRSGQSDRRLGMFRARVATGTSTETDVWGEERDVARYANVGYYVPGGDMFQTSASPIPKESSGMLGLLASGVNATAETAMSNPLLSIMSAAATGEDQFLKRPLGSLDSSYIPGSEDEKHRTMEFLKYFYRTAFPNLPIIPGTHSNTRLLKGLAHSGAISEATADALGVTGYNSLGMPMDLLTQTENFVGLRMSSVDIEDSLSRRLTRIDMSEKEATKILRQIEKNPAIPEPSKDTAGLEYDKTVDKFDILRDRLEDLYTAGTSAKAKLQKAKARRAQSLESSKPGLGF